MARRLAWVCLGTSLLLLAACSAGNGSPSSGLSPTITFATFPPVTATPFPAPPPISTVVPLSQPTQTTAPSSIVPNIASPTSEPLDGTFVFSAGDGSIWLVNAESGEATNVVPSTPGQFASAPSFSPDGQEIIFVIGVIDQTGQGHDSIRARKLDGTGERIVLELDDPTTSLNFPTISQDGAWLYYTANIPLPEGGRRNDIQRFSLANHTVETVVRDARQQSLSDNGANMTFIRFDPRDFTASLWISDGEGKNERQLLAEDVFDIIYAPRFAPDGSAIVFAASGPNKKPLPGLTAERSCEPVLLCLFAVAASAATDGLPWELYSVTPDGAKFTRLTDMRADSPYPAWSHDGADIGMLTARGMFVYNTHTHENYQINSIGAHGSLDWWQAK